MIGSRSGHFYQAQHDCDGWVAVYVMCWPSEPFISQLNSPESAIFVGGSGDEALVPQLLSGTAFTAVAYHRCLSPLLRRHKRLMFDVSELQRLAQQAQCRNPRCVIV